MKKVRTRVLASTAAPVMASARGHAKRMLTNAGAPADYTAKNETHPAVRPNTHTTSVRTLGSTWAARFVVAARWLMRAKRMVSAAILGVVLAAGAPVAAEQGARGSTVVVHGVTYTQSFRDDICGPRASEETVTIRTTVLHYTETADGTFNAHFTETGTIHVDFDDPALQDFDSQFTDSIHHVLTAGGTETFIETFHQVSGELKIWSRIHVHFVDGRLMFEREAGRVTGCP